MVVLNCSDYGFIYKFKIRGQEEQVIDEFKTHMNNKHGKITQQKRYSK